MENEKVVTVI